MGTIFANTWGEIITQFQKLSLIHIYNFYSIIMKEAKQPWPRSAKITVWVLGIIIAASAIVNILTISQWYGPYQKWSDTVSYTHLDVYKRQNDRFVSVVIFLGYFHCEIGKRWARAVSQS